MGIYCISLSNFLYWNASSINKINKIANFIKSITIVVHKYKSKQTGKLKRISVLFHYICSIILCCIIWDYLQIFMLALKSKFVLRANEENSTERKI